MTKVHHFTIERPGIRPITEIKSDVSFTGFKRNIPIITIQRIHIFFLLTDPIIPDILNLTMLIRKQCIYHNHMFPPIFTNFLLSFSFC